MLIDCDIEEIKKCAKKLTQKQIIEIVDVYYATLRDFKKEKVTSQETEGKIIDKENGETYGICKKTE